MPQCSLHGSVCHWHDAEGVLTASGSNLNLRGFNFEVTMKFPLLQCVHAAGWCGSPARGANPAQPEVIWCAPCDSEWSISSLRLRRRATVLGAAYAPAKKPGPKRLSRAAPGGTVAGGHKGTVALPS